MRQPHRSSPFQTLSPSPKDTTAPHNLLNPTTTTHNGTIHFPFPTNNIARVLAMGTLLTNLTPGVRRRIRVPPNRKSHPTATYCHIPHLLKRYAPSRIDSKQRIRRKHRTLDDKRDEVELTMGREAEEWTDPFESTHDGAAHRSRVVKTIEWEKRNNWYWTHFSVCVLAGIDIPIVVLSLFFAIRLEDVLCISSGVVFGTTVVLCMLSFVIGNREESFNNPKAACIFYSRVHYDEDDHQHFMRFNEHEKLSRLFVQACKFLIRRWGKARCCFWGTFAILFAISAVTTACAFFTWPDSTLLCGMGMMVGIGSWVAACLVYAVQILVMHRLRSRQIGRAHV